MPGIGVGIGVGIGSSSHSPQTVQRAFEGNILLAAVVDFLGATAGGDLIKLVEPAWNAVLNEIEKDPDLIYKFGDRKWEEILAAAYDAEGYRVELTKRSGDGGVDVIATATDGPKVTVFDQMKAFSPKRRVTANDVRAMMGVVHYAGATRGVVTTTAEFAPRIRLDPYIAKALKHDLQLVNGTALRDRLLALKKS